jgi:hypothetical protein
MGGRLGGWYIWDKSVDLVVADGSAGEAPPPSSWNVSQCAAWVSGGELYSYGDESAGMGVTLNDTSPYNTCKYTGIEVTYGSANPVIMRFKYGLTSSASYTSVTLPSNSTATTKAVTIPSSICDRIQDIQFVPYDWTSFGYAIFKLSFY